MTPQKYLIFGSTLSQAKNFLYNLVLSQQIPFDQISRHNKSFNHESILLNDGTIYQVVSASSNARGNKCHKAYVSYDVDKDILDNVIKGCLIGNWDDRLDDEDRIIYY